MVAAGSLRTAQLLPPRTPSARSRRWGRPSGVTSQSRRLSHPPEVTQLVSDGPGTPQPQSHHRALFPRLDFACSIITWSGCPLPLPHRPLRGQRWARASSSSLFPQKASQMEAHALLRLPCCQKAKGCGEHLTYSFFNVFLKLW